MPPLDKSPPKSMEILAKDMDGSINHIDSPMHYQKPQGTREVLPGTKLTRGHDAETLEMDGVKLTVRNDGSTTLEGAGAKDVVKSKTSLGDTEYSFPNGDKVIVDKEGIRSISQTRGGNSTCVEFARFKSSGCGLEDKSATTLPPMEVIKPGQNK